MSSKPAVSPPSALVSFLINVLVPVCLLSYMSDGDISLWERPEERNFWDLGPLWSLVVALSLPFVYGFYTLIRIRKVELMTAVGVISVLLTGTVSFFVIKEGGAIEPSTPWLFGLKEALIPLTLAGAILVSHRSVTPLLRVFIYTPELFDIRLIEKKIGVLEQESAYQRLLWTSTLILVLALVLSAVLNFFLSVHFIEPILDEPLAQQQVLYNQAVGKITGWGFLVIGLPMLIAMGIIIMRLIRSLMRLTGLSQEKLMLR